MRSKLFGRASNSPRSAKPIAQRCNRKESRGRTSRQIQDVMAENGRDRLEKKIKQDPRQTIILTRKRNKTPCFQLFEAPYPVYSGQKCVKRAQPEKSSKTFYFALTLKEDLSKIVAVEKDDCEGSPNLHGGPSIQITLRNIMFYRHLWAVLALSLFAIPAMAQEAAENTTDAPAEIELPTELVTEAAIPALATSSTAMIDELGTLHGFIYRVDGNQKLPVEAKVTLSKDGKVVESVMTDESGTFSIPNVEPGVYDMFAAADSFVGNQTYEVTGFSDQYTGVAAVDMAVGTPAAATYVDAAPMTYAAPAAQVYDNYSSLPVSSFSSCQAPVASYSSGCGSCSPCGGCAGGRFGGGLGGGGGFGGGGGLLGGGGSGAGFGRLLPLAIAGGVVAIAVGGDDDASPDE